MVCFVVDVEGDFFGFDEVVDVYVIGQYGIWL